MLRSLFLLVAFCQLDAASAQNLENGTYVGTRRFLFAKFAILTVENETAQFEVFTTWQGEKVPGIGAWDKTYRPQKLVHVENGGMSNENVRIRKKKHIKGTVKNTFFGRMRFKFEKVDLVPETYEEFRLEAINFVNRED